MHSKIYSLQILHNWAQDITNIALIKTNVMKMKVIVIMTHIVKSDFCVEKTAQVILVSQV